VVGDLARATRTHTCVEIDYYSAGSGRRRMRGVDPYGLINKVGSWYLVGRCHINDATRIYKCERIAQVKQLDLRFEIPPDFDLDRFRKDHLKLPAGRGGRIRLRGHGESARSAAAWPDARKRPDGTVELSLKEAATEWMVTWVLGFGGDGEVLAPPELRAQVAERLSAIAEMHGAKAGAGA
jgi:predicted DNA-binding transcriptional regulator YafY